MGIDYEIKWNILCPKCGFLNKTKDFFNIFKLPCIESGYGWDYVLRCSRCHKQLIRVRVG